LQRLASDKPDDSQLQKQLAIVESRHGVALLKSGKPKQAEEQLQQAVRGQERLLARHPKDESLEADLALSLSSLGLAQQHLRQSGQAEVSLDDAAAREFVVRWLSAASLPLNCR
jgi:Flp pilus assembly protein TadD